MRKQLMLVWRRITKIKLLMPLIMFIRYFAGTNLFNTILDGIEVRILKTTYQESRSFFQSHIEKINEINELLEDGKSKRVYSNIWQYRCSHYRRYLKGIVDHDQYFDGDIIKLRDGEVFVDCGAYHGDTVQKFIRKLQGKDFRKIFAFEPDEFNYRHLVQNVQKSGCFDKIVCIKRGTWSQKAALPFNGNTEEGCAISETGNTTIQTDTIDNVAGNESVSFIKMDVEGAELESLRGAHSVIDRFHPRLAISIYHSDDDMVDIPEYIHAEWPFYKLFIRHYTYFYADTIVYAVDESREAGRGECR